jgi:uncharacterized repeat protein (TIGR01451 family)
MTRRFVRKNVLSVFAISATGLMMLFSQESTAQTVAPSSVHPLRAGLMQASGNAPASISAMPTKKFSRPVPDSGNPVFLPAASYGTGGAYAVSVAIADMNGDGKPDLVVANNFNCPSADCETNGTVSVLLGNGDGTFQSAVSYNSGGWDAVSVAVADVDGDGKPDVIVANQCPLNGCATGVGVAAILLGNGDGTLKLAVPYALGASSFLQPDTVTVADLNGDGKPDLVLALNGALVDVLLGNGDGTFQPAVAYGFGCCQTSSVLVADVNGDGKPDLLLAFAYFSSCTDGDCGPGQVSVLLGKGDGTFQSPSSLISTGGDWASSIAVADVNGDGKADLIVGNECSEWSQQGFCSGPGSLGVLFGNGDGTFQPSQDYSFGGLSYLSEAVADVNGDGKPDLVALGCPSTGTFTYCGGPGDGSLEIMVGNNDGTFQSPVLFDAGGVWPKSVAIADLNGDGKPDVAFAIWNSAGLVNIMLNNGVGSVIPTRTALVSSLNPSNVGQNVTFTARVSSSSGTPTGTVIFYDGSNSLGSATLASGRALLSTSSLAAGSHAITASYQGTGTFAPSVSAVLNQVVNGTGISTTTTLTSSKNPGIYLQPVTFTAVVTSASGTPMGTVIFSDGKAQFPAATLVNGVATYTTSDLKRDWYAITAQYLGSGSFDPSTSPILNERINGNGLFLTRIHLSSSDSNSLVGQSVTFTATMSAERGEIPQDGDTVLFSDDGTQIGSGTTKNGAASFTWSSQMARHHTIGASFQGDDDFSRRYTQITQIVNANPTVVHVSASPNPALYGQTVTFTVSVTSSGPDTPTGEVRFPDVGLLPLSGGVATVTKSQLRAGTHAIVVEYLGDAASAKSKSAPFDEVVNPAPTTTTLTSSINPSASGQKVTFTATVTSSSGLDPFGKVTFTAGTTTLGTMALKDTTASVSTSALPVGSNTITAIYSGSDSFVASSASLTQTVHQ